MQSKSIVFVFAIVYLVSDTFDDDPSVLNEAKSHDDDVDGDEGVVGQIINSEKNNFVRFD